VIRLGSEHVACRLPPGAFEWFVGQFKVAVGELEKRVRAEENALKLRRLMGN
jgi:hypothetical protein